MTLTIKGEDQLYRRFNSLTKVMKTTFWGLVKDDLYDTLKENTKKHYSSKSKLERNIYSKTIDGGVEAGVSNDGMIVDWGGKRVNYAVFVNSGTSDHDIAPKNKKALRWVGAGGRNFFSKGHKVKGITASHFIENTAKEVFDRLDNQFTKALKSEGL